MMISIKKLIYTPLLLSLIACHPQENTQSPHPASAPESASSIAANHTMASAVSAPDVSASAASETKSQNLGRTLSPLDTAKWQNYQCDEGKLTVRYYQDKKTPSAQIKYKNNILTAPFSPSDSNEELTAFSNHTYTWTIGNEFETDFYKESNGFLVFHEKQEGMTGEDGMVDNLLLQNCRPI